MMASTAISGVIYLKIMHMVAQKSTKEQLADLMIRIERIQAVLLRLMLAVFLYCWRDSLHLMGGQNHREESFYRLGGNRPDSARAPHPPDTKHGHRHPAGNIHKGRAVILFYSSAVCVILGDLISLRYGAIGMFTGTAISLFFGQIFLINPYYSRQAGLSIKRFFVQVYIPCYI